MLYNKILFTILLIIGISFNCFAQLDNPKTHKTSKKGKIIGNINTSAKKAKKPKSLNFNNDNGFKTANKKLQQEKKRKEAEEKLKYKGIISPEMLAKQNFEKNVEGNFKNFPMIDMDLGSFHTKLDHAYISAYDFGRFDGDKVAVYVNNKPVQTNFLLVHRIKTIKIPLDIGINTIEVIALNEGELSPNTGAFSFFDGNKEIILKNKWLLATGAKVKAIMVREK